MQFQVIIKKEKTCLRLLKRGKVAGESFVNNRQLSEKLLSEIDKLLKENKMKKNQLCSVEVWPKKIEEGSTRLVHVISCAANYCLTK